MEKYCTKCGSELHTGARFCTKCGAAVFNEAENSVPAAQPDHVPQPQPNSEAQPPKYTPPVATPKRKSTAAPKRNGGSNVLCIVLSVLLVIQTVVVALYGWPGFLTGGRDAAAVETEKATVSMDNPSVTLAGVSIDANTLNLMAERRS